VSQLAELLQLRRPELILGSGSSEPWRRWQWSLFEGTVRCRCVLHLSLLFTIFGCGRRIWS